MSVGNCLIMRVVTRKSDLSFPVRVETEGLTIECIHTVLGANNSKVSKITTSNCMRRNHDRVLITHSYKNSLDVDTFS